MKTTISEFIKADDNTVINTRSIKWIKKMNECLEVCTKSIGCIKGSEETHKICQYKTSNSYNELNKLFK